MDVLGIALSGMQSAEARIGVSAHNVANLLTGDFRPQRVEQVSRASGGSEARVRQADRREPVRLEREVVDQILARTQYTASARVFSVGAELSGTLLDILA
ncbi:MAG TPA: flagellar basal body rod protein [Deltaproteobacteria bacterium]|nr:flagellar basal body rod protein [Deltaproteobacteria bacterium]